jgi:hypothetical protein
MKRTGSVFTLGSEFDNFLLAPIGDDNNGMLLSVLSALARLDVDPWEEAAVLARLPGDVATRAIRASGFCDDCCSFDPAVTAPG